MLGQRTFRVRVGVRISLGLKVRIIVRVRISVGPYTKFIRTVECCYCYFELIISQGKHINSVVVSTLLIQIKYIIIIIKLYYRLAVTHMRRQV